MGHSVLGVDGFLGRSCSPAKDGRLAVTGAGLKGTTVSPTSLVHLAPPLAECVVGGLWSGVRVSRHFLKEHGVSAGWCREAVRSTSGVVCGVEEPTADGASLTHNRSEPCWG